MICRDRSLLSLASIYLLSALSALAADWPGWRGDGSGISPETGLPVRWDAATNIAWKTALPGKGKSSPIVWQGRVFLTASADGGKKRSAICLDANDGRILWQKDFAAAEVAKTNPKNGYASPTPATDGKQVYAFFDSPGLVALDLDGKLSWTRPLGPFKTDWGMASSPVLHKGLVVQCCDQDGGGFIVGVDAATGQVRWRTPRTGPRGYATPLLISHNGRPQIVVNGRTIVAYDPDTGRELWSCREMMHPCSPSAVFGNGLIYAASGRNGPAMAIDPGGHGDVTDSYVRWFLPIGGPYVISPIVYPLPCLPGDNGHMRFIDAQGRVALEERLRGHFNASPVGAEGRVYWTNERGVTHVLDVARVASGKPGIKVLAANPLGERVYASPAIANGRLFIRTAKHLFCIAGAGEPEAPVAAAPPTSFAELKKQYEAHPAEVGEEVIFRIEAVEALAKIKAPQAIALLQDAALKDPHWDVSEAAAKALGPHGEAALPAAIAVFGSNRSYLRAIAAKHMGQWKAAGGVPTLIKGTRDRDPLVRIHSLRALTQIALAHDAEAPTIVLALASGLADREGVVRQAAIEALGPLADKAGVQRDAIVKELLDCAADVNPLVARSALDALSGAFKVPDGVVMRDQVLYGRQRKDPAVEHLEAGPIRVKFQDGELRYLYVGEKEIVRRIYFAVRDKHWNTALPRFARIEVQKRERGFRIRLSAACKNALADYSWDGEMEGHPDGRITFRANGHANADFESPRIGICLLFGAGSLAGQAFEAVGKDGKVKAGRFPRLVSSPLIATEFKSLSYTTKESMKVAATLSGSLFDMEDQRNFGDSSYKAFTPIPHTYPRIARGSRASHTLAVRVKNAQPKPLPEGLIRVALGQVVEGAKMPKVRWADQAKKARSFWWVNLPPQHQKLKDENVISWFCNPAVHLPDDDTLMENLPTVLDQVRTVRSFAPRARVRIEPITIDFKGTPPGSDPRNRALFAAAWSAGLIKYLALAGVDEAAFRVGPASAKRTQGDLAKCAGWKVVATRIEGPGPLPVDALAAEGEGKRLLWLINKTGQRQKVVVNGSPAVDLAPFEVRQVALQGR